MGQYLFVWSRSVVKHCVDGFSSWCGLTVQAVLSEVGLYTSVQYSALHSTLLGFAIPMEVGHQWRSYRGGQGGQLPPPPALENGKFGNLPSGGK